MKQNVNIVVGGPIKSSHPCQYKTKILKTNIPFKEQLEDNPNTKFVIKWDFDLGGEEVVISENCILEFDGGSICNGSIVGNDTIVKFDSPFLSNAYMSDCVSDKNFIKDTDVFKSITCTVNEIKTIISIVKDNGYCVFTGSLYKDVADIVIEKGVSIDFCGAEIHPVHRDTGDNSQVFKAVEIVDKFELKNVKIDGGIDVPFANVDVGTGVRNSAILVKNAANVVFDNVEITNYACGCYGQERNPDGFYEDQSVVVILYYKNLSITGCKLSSSSEEGYVISPVVGENNAVIANNEVTDFAHTGFNFTDGKLLFENNKIINSIYSGANLLCYDSIIRNNHFKDSGTNDSALDLTEQKSYYAYNIVIENNTIEGFNTAIAVLGSNIDIDNNVIKSTYATRDCVRLLYPDDNDNYTYNRNNLNIKHGNYNVRIRNNDMLAANPLNLLSAEGIEITGNTLTLNGLAGVGNKHWGVIMDESVNGTFIFNDNIVNGEGEGKGDRATPPEKNGLDVWIHTAKFVQINNNTFNITEAANRAVYVRLSGICDVEFCNNKCNRDSNVIFNSASYYIRELKFEKNENIIFHRQALEQYINQTEEGVTTRVISSMFELLGDVVVNEGRTIIFAGGGIKANSLRGTNVTLKGDLSNNDLYYAGSFVIDTSGISRPRRPLIGTMFYDTNLNKPIFYKGFDEEHYIEMWVDALGNPVDTVYVPAITGGTVGNVPMIKADGTLEDSTKPASNIPE